MAVQDPPTATSVRKPVCVWFILRVCVSFCFLYSEDVSLSSRGPSGKLAAVIRFDMREDRKYEGEQKQGMVLKNGGMHSETRDCGDRRLQIQCRGQNYRKEPVHVRTGVSTHTLYTRVRTLQLHRGCFAACPLCQNHCLSNRCFLKCVNW